MVAKQLSNITHGEVCMALAVYISKEEGISYSEAEIKLKNFPMLDMQEKMKSMHDALLCFWVSRNKIK